MPVLYDEELSLSDFQKRFADCVAEFIIDGTKQICYVLTVNDESVRVKFWNKETLKWSNENWVHYSKFESCEPMKSPGWYNTLVGGTGLSYKHVRQWRHGYHPQRNKLWPESQMNFMTRMALLLTADQGTSEEANNLNQVLGGGRLNNPHVSGMEL